jgi:5'-nucleotidase
MSASLVCMMALAWLADVAPAPPGVPHKPAAPRVNPHLFDRDLKPAVPAKDGGDVVVSVVGTSDLHGHLEALPWLGGHLANLRRQRAADGGALVLVDAGDMFQGTLESNLAEGAPVVKAYNALGYAAASLGNHEFDFGPAGPPPSPAKPGDDPRGALKARARQAQFPFLAANLEENGKPLAWFNVRPSTIVEAAGIKVGIVGVTTPTAGQTTLPANAKGLDFAPLAPAIVREATRLRAEGAQVIVGVAHEGGQCQRFEDPGDLGSCDIQTPIMALARALPEGTLDVLVAGHSHEGIAHRAGKLPVIESYSLGRAFGRVDVIVDRATGRVLDARIFAPHFVCGENGEATRPGDSDKCHPEPYEGSEVKPDPRIAALLAPVFKAADPKRKQPAGVNVVAEFNHNSVDETPIGNLFVDLMRETHPRADAAFMTSGNIRGRLPVGRLQFGALFEVLPFENSLATLVLTGDELAGLLRPSFEKKGRPFFISGLRVQARCEGGHVVLDLRREDGTPVQPTEKLTIVTNDFLATGGDGVFQKVQARIESRRLVRESIFQLLKKHGGTLDPKSPALAPGRVSAPGPRPVTCSSP